MKKESHNASAHLLQEAQALYSARQTDDSETDKMQLGSTIQENPAVPYTPVASQGGLSELQKSTTNMLTNMSKWGFGDSKLNVRRHKLDNQNWQLTVENPKTRKTILQAEGHGDTVFAHEDNLARMAQILMAQGLTIRTEFDE